MTNTVTIGSRTLGDGHPTYIIGEIGINHNGSMEITKRLIDAAVAAGCQAVKFQKRTPELCVPEDQRLKERETPWGVMTYFDYRIRMEFSLEQYQEIDRYCREVGIDWFVSCWDVDSVDFIEQLTPVAHKIASASLTDDELIAKVAATGRPVLLSTGMSTMEEITHAVSLIPRSQLVLSHTTSAYPCEASQLNLRMIPELRKRFGVPVGYSGHEKGLQTTYAAVVLGACFVERHITLDRAMWGSDQAASVEPAGLIRMVRDIRVIEAALGDGVKQVYDSERPIMARLRKVKGANA